MRKKSLRWYCAGIINRVLADKRSRTKKRYQRDYSWIQDVTELAILLMCLSLHAGLHSKKAIIELWKSYGVKTSIACAFCLGIMLDHSIFWSGADGFVWGRWTDLGEGGG